MAKCEFAQVSKSGRLICYNEGEDLKESSPSSESSQGNARSVKRTYEVCPFQKYCGDSHTWITVGAYMSCKRRRMHEKCKAQDEAQEELSNNTETEKESGSNV